MQVLEKMKGKDLAGRTYKPLFPYFEARKLKGSFKVCADTYVTADSGTGVVHQAPAFGEDDYRISLANGELLNSSLTFPHLDWRSVTCTLCAWGCLARIVNRT